MYRTSHSSIARYICRTQAHARFDALGERWFLFTAPGAMPRLEEATTISPGQSSGAKAEERHPGYMFPVYHVRPVRTATYSLLYAVALTERWYVNIICLPRVLPWARCIWAFSPTSTLSFEPALAM